MMKRSVLTVLLSLLFCVLAGAQSDSLRYAVRGSVRDASTGRPVPYAYVSIPGTNYATVTNEDGTFVLKSSTEPSSVAFSCMGYRRQSLSPAEDMRVRLERSVTLLRASTVIDGDPREILRDAIEQVPRNYSRVPELYDCFYRETAMKRQRFVNISEAVLRLYKSPYSQSIYRDYTGIEKSRNLVSPRAADTLSVKVLGGPTQAIDLDIAKNPSMLFDEEYLDLYSLSMDSPVYFDERLQLVIKMTPGHDSPVALYNGTIYIDAETLAFSRIEMSLDMSSEENATRAMLVRKPMGLRFKPREMSFVVSYMPDGGVFRLNYVRTVFRFGCDWRRRLLSTNFTCVNEMVVTGRHEIGANPPIAKTDRFSSRESLSDVTQRYADPDFWADYNIIEPTESLEHAIDRLHK